MMGSALEAQLVCSIRMAEHILRSARNWPSGDPAKWTLGPLVETAKAAGWFQSAPGLDDALEGLNVVRVCCIHPAAFIRDGAWPLREHDFTAIFHALNDADRTLGDAVSNLPPPPS